MEDISRSCQHYVVLACDQELALSGAEELLPLSANAGQDALCYSVVKKQKPKNKKNESLRLRAAFIEALLCHNGRCHWEVTEAHVSHGEGCPLAPPYHWLNETSGTGTLWGISFLALASHQLVGLSAFSAWEALIPIHRAHSHVLVWPRAQQPGVQTKTPLLGPPAGSQSSSKERSEKLGI